MRLAGYELQKIWKNKNFLTAMLVLLVLNVFLLWYRNIPDEGENLFPEAEVLSKEEQEAYRAAYDKYLDDVEKEKENLTGISIFAGNEGTGFASRNIQKSAEDYGTMKGTEISWQPSDGICLAMENRMTDIFLLLGVLLFVQNLLMEEKEKKLLFVTRVTKNGISRYLSGKLAALGIHTLVMTALFLLMNLGYAAATTGIGNLSVSVQSLAACRESTLHITVFGYILLSVLTKWLVVTAFGIWLTLAAILAEKSILVPFCGVTSVLFSMLLYLFVPAYSGVAPLKYLNIFGAMETEELYGAYLNLDIGGYPLSRTSVTLFVTGFVILLGIVLCYVSFVRGKNLGVKEKSALLKRKFAPHGSILKHEAYKILVMNRGLLILLFFVVLIGYYGMSRTYHPSAKEEYYRMLMQELEGPLTEEKEALILSEEKRFAKAEEEIARIDSMAALGELDSLSADAMKMEWEGILAFKSSFERIEFAYEKAKAEKGIFLYDTGYLYLFGKQDNSLELCFLLVSLGIVLAFFNVLSMEDGAKSWILLGTTRAGRRKIIRCKAAVCGIAAFVLSVIPWIFRGISIGRTFPMHRWQTMLQTIPAYENSLIPMPIFVFLLLRVAMQGILAAGIAFGTLRISGWRKNEGQAIVFSLIVFVVPQVIVLLLI